MWLPFAVNNVLVPVLLVLDVELLFSDTGFVVVVVVAAAVVALLLVVELVGLNRLVFDLDRFEDRLEAELGLEADWYEDRPFVLSELFDPVKPLEDPTPVVDPEELELLLINESEFKLGTGELDRTFFFIK